MLKRVSCGPLNFAFSSYSDLKKKTKNKLLTEVPKEEAMYIKANAPTLFFPTF